MDFRNPSDSSHNELLPDITNKYELTDDQLALKEDNDLTSGETLANQALKKTLQPHETGRKNNPLQMSVSDKDARFKQEASRTSHDGHFISHVARQNYTNQASRLTLENAGQSRLTLDPIGGPTNNNNMSKVTVELEETPIEERPAEPVFGIIQKEEFDQNDFSREKNQQTIIQPSSSKLSKYSGKSSKHQGSSNQIKPAPRLASIEQAAEAMEKTMNSLKAASSTKSKRSQKRKNINNEYDQSLMDMTRHNKMKRPELSGMNLEDVKKIGDTSLRNMVHQSKMINELKRLKEDYDEDDERSDDEIDDPFDMEDFHPGAKNQDQNKNVFRRNYGIETQLQGYYIQSASIWPKNLKYVVRIIKFVCPQDPIFKCQTFKLDQMPETGKEKVKLEESEILTAKDMFMSDSNRQDKLEPKYYQHDSCVIQLLYAHQNYLEILHEVVTNMDSKFEVEFSLKGDFLCLFARHKSILRVFQIGESSRDLENVIANINNDDAVFRDYKDLEQLKYCKKIYFGRNERLLAAYGDHEVLLFNLKTKENQIFKIFEIDAETFEPILDLQLTSWSDDKPELFQCEVACKRKSGNVVQIWDLNTLKPRNIHNVMAPPQYEMDKKKQIFYLVDKHSKNKKQSLKVKIQKDFNKIILSYGADTYELKNHDGEYIQRMMQLSESKEKKISQMICEGREIYFLLASDFDTDIQVKHSLDKDFNVKVPFLLTPGLNQRILDINLDNEKMVFILQTDSNFFYQSIDLHQKKFLKALDDKSIHQISCMWPYISYIDNQNIIWVICGFDQYILKRIVLPYDTKKARLQQVYITEDYDLFVMVNHFEHKKYELLMIDLDNPQPFYDFRDQNFILKSVMSYSYALVGERELDDMIVRSSSDKALVGQNKRMFLFILHKNELYFWCQGSQAPEYIDSTKSRRIQNKQLSHSSFYYESFTNESLEEIKIMRIDMRFSTFAKTELYSEKAPTGSQILAWAFDNECKKMIVLYNVEIFNGFQKKVIVYDLINRKRIGVAIMQDPELINRFISRQFLIMNGHMYFDNQVLKIRYDSMLFTKSDFIGENNFIDKYNNILDMKKGERVFAQMPVISMSCHKQIYMLSNQLYRQPMKLIVMPYMHERKLFLNTMKETNKYFYTIFEDDEKDIFMDKKKTQEQQRVMNYIISLDITGHKGFIYSEGGLLYDRFDYNHLAARVGIPIGVSSNGKVFLFQNPKQKRRVYICQLTMVDSDKEDKIYNKKKVFKMEFVKKIDVLMCLADYVNVFDKSTMGTNDHKQAILLRNKLVEDYSKFMIEKNNIYHYKVNDTHDVVVEISNIIDSDLQKQFNVMFPESERKTVMKILELVYEVFNNKVKKKKLSEEAKRIRSLKKGKIRELRNQLSLETQEFMSEKKLSIEKQLKLWKAIQNMQGSIFYLQRGDYEAHNSRNIVEDTYETEIASSLWAPEKFNSNQSKLDTDTKNALTPKFVVSDKDSAKSNRANLQRQLDKQKIIFSKEIDLFQENYTAGNFTIGAKSLFFWNFYHAWKIEFRAQYEKVQGANLLGLGLSLRNSQLSTFVDAIEKKPPPQPYKKFSLHVDKDNQESYIKKISVGSSDEQTPNNCICIVVRTSKSSDSVIIWDIYNDCEVGQFDTSPNAIITFDAHGHCYIVEESNIIVTQQNVRLASFSTQCINKDNISQLAFDLTLGHHFDYINHNFMLLNEYIGLSFSFMNLVIRDKHQSIDDANEAMDYDLDEDQFNYNINKKTFMTCDNFVTFDYRLLEDVLAFLKTRNPVLLEQLHYYFTEEIKVNEENSYSALEDMFGKVNYNAEKNAFIIKWTPLRIAKNNSKSANIILNYMSKIDTNASGTFCDLLPLFIESSMFIKYLEQIPFQSLEMTQKGTLAIENQYSDRIVKIVHSPFSFVDEAFYKGSLGEDKENTSFTNFVIKMTALRVDWIIQKEQGKIFLESLVNADQEELFESDTIIAIIEYLYMNFKWAVIKKSFPVYFLQLSGFFLSVLIPVSKNFQWYHWIPFVMDYFNCLIGVYTLFFVYHNIINSGVTVFFRPWIYCDCVYVILIFIISIQRIIENLETPGESNDKQISDSDGVLYNIRIMQAFLSIAIFGKLLYFMQIIDQIAPLIRIIILIFGDIKWFLVVYIITVFAFSNSFELLGRNLNDIFALHQAELKENNGGEMPDLPEFTSTIGAFTHVYRIGLGDFDFDGYTDFLDDKSANKTHLSLFFYLFWYISGFLLQIHFLNMLIAIMGETFSKNNETKHISFIKSHLQFVLDNWYQDPIKDKHRINYLITAFVKDDENEDSEVLKEMIKNQQQVEELIEDKFQDLNDLISANHMSMNHLVTRLSEQIEDLQAKQRNQ